MTVTLVTGASSGIGRSLARRLATAGHPVAVLARREALLASLVDEIEAAGGRAIAVPADVTIAADITAAVARAEATLGPIERLIANAGGGSARPADRFDTAEIAQALELNVLGVARCVEAVLPGMLARGSGHLVATSSLAGVRGLPAAAAYGAAKAALTNMMESLRIGLRPHGVDVTLVAPGFVQVRERSDGKKKPFELALEDATALMARAIEQRRPHLAFPMPLVVALGLSRLLPASAYDRLVSRMGTAV